MSKIQLSKKIIDESWDFKYAKTKYATHGFHSYPAMMIPQIARRLIRTYGKNAKVVLDPFMGSGTTLVECKLHHWIEKGYGIDINPLAILLTKVKTTPIDPELLWKNYNILTKKIHEDFEDYKKGRLKLEKPNFFNIDFWFKPQVIDLLTIIKTRISEIENKDIRDFFLVAFSETVRNVSNTRKSEFKLYRIPEDKLKDYNPDVIGEFEKKAKQNIGKMRTFVRSQNSKCEVVILENADTRHKIDVSEEVDLVVTSPPYGDSRTTVAYGQFSRLSLQWLGFDKKTVFSIDYKSLGGFKPRYLSHNLPSETFSKVLEQVREKDYNRAKDVLSFFLDLDKCVIQIDKVMKKGGYVCFVVGNRTVRGVHIPLDDITAELFIERGYTHIKTIIRNIPNKKMPRNNSPNNIKGQTSRTINKEGIVILRKD